MKVSEIMSSKVATCKPSDSLRDVAKIMRDKDCGAIPILEGGRLTGIITDRDIVMRGVAEGKNVMDMDARSCMTKKVRSVSQDTDVHDLCTLMEKEQIRRVVVTDSSDHIVGIVAQADVALNAPERETADVVKKVSKYPFRTCSRQL